MLRAFLLMAAMLCGSIAAAQSPTAIVTGLVRDAGHTPLAGARVVIGNDAVTTAVRTGADGLFRCEMPPGVYAVRITFDGFQDGELAELVLEVGARVDLDAPLRVPGVEEKPWPAITAIALPAATTTTVDARLIDALPLDRDNAFASLLELTPGVARGAAFGTPADIGTPRRLDGLDLTDPLDGQAWTSFVLPSAAGSTVRLGVDASERDGSGAVLDVVTRAGGAALHGLVDVLGTGRAWTRDAVPEETLTANPHLADRDRLGRSLRIAGVVSGSMSPRLGFGLAIEHADEARAGEAGATTRTPRGHGRLVWSRDARSIGVVGFLDHSSTTHEVPPGIGPIVVPGLERTRTRSTAAARGYWQATIRPSLNASASVDVLRGTRDTTPQSDVPGRDDAVTGELSGSVGRLTSGDRTRALGAGAVDWQTHAGGTHDVRVGGEFERSRVGERDGFVGGEFFHDLAGRPDTVEVWAGSARTAHLGREAIFVTDTWRPARRLSITAGIRAAHLAGSDGEGGATYATTAIQPRAGATVAIDGAGRLVARAHYGVVADPLYASHVDRTLGGDTAVVTLQILPDGRRVEIGRISPIMARVADGVGHPRTRELVGGVDYLLHPSIRVGGTVVLRRYEQAIDAIYTGARWIPQVRTDLDGRVLLSYRWANRAPGDEPTIMNVDGLGYTASDGSPIGTAAAERRYTGLVLNGRADLPGGRGSIAVAYARATSLGTLDDTHVSGVGPNDTFASPTVSLNNADGESSLTPADELTVFGTAKIPKLPVQVSAIYLRQAGTRYAALRILGRVTLDVPFGADGRTLRLEPRGARTLDPIHELTLRVGTTVPVTHGRRLDVYADIQNVLATSIVTGVETGYPFGASAPTGTPVSFETPIELQRPLRVLVGGRYRF